MNIDQIYVKAVVERGRSCSEVECNSSGILYFGVPPLEHEGTKPPPPLLFSSEKNEPIQTPKRNDPILPPKRKMITEHLSFVSYGGTM